MVPQDPQEISLDHAQRLAKPRVDLRPCRTWLPADLGISAEIRKSRRLRPAKGKDQVALIPKREDLRSSPVNHFGFVPDPRERIPYSWRFDVAVRKL